MRITPFTPTSGVTKYGKVNKASAAQNSFGMGNDQLQISDSAQSFAQVYKAAQKAINTTSVEYQQKVESVAQRIQDGSYSVPSEDVAARIVDDLV